MNQPQSAERLSLPPIAWWTLQPGLKQFHSADEGAYVAYRVSDGMAVTLGEPIGRPGSIPGLITEFSHWCSAQGLRPCWWHITSRWLPEIKAQGGRLAQIGEFGLIDLPGLNFSGRAWRDVRASLLRLPRCGYSLRWFNPADGNLELLSSVRRISSEWLAGRRLPELCHSLGTLQSLLSGGKGQRCIVLIDPAGEAQAFISFVPFYCEGGGYVLDMLRYNPLLPRDSVLFLLASALLQFQEEGLAAFALGLAPLSIRNPECPEAPVEDTPLPLRALRGLVWQRSRSYYNFQGLAFFKQRFHPRWEPRYVAYPRLMSLPRTLRALCHVHGLRARTLLSILAG